jgi:alpha-glucosidase
MNRLRATYDALNVMSRMGAPPDPLVDAMQTGDRLSYHPETATEEVAHFHAVLPQAQSAVAGVGNLFRPRIEEVVKWAQDENRNMGGEAFNADAQRQRLLDALDRAEKLAGEAGK